MDLFAQSLFMTLLWLPASACTALGDGPPRNPPTPARVDARPADGPRTDGERLDPADVVLQAVVTPAGDCNSPVWLTEFFPDPARVPDGVGEYIELYNPGDVPVRLNGWRLTDLRRDSHVLSSEVALTVPPHGAFVLGSELDERANGSVKLDYRYDRFHLSNKSDRIRLEDACGAVVIDLVYPTDPGLPEVRAGRSVEMTRPPSPGKSAAWQQSRSKMARGDHGTPGKVPFATPLKTTPTATSGASARAKGGEQRVVQEAVGRHNAPNDGLRLIEHKP